MEAVLSICKKEQVEALIVLLDVELDVWNDCRELLAEQKVILCASGPEAISLCRDKRKLFLYLEDKMPGCLIPTFSLSECSPEALSYPAVCKPYNGRSSQGLKCVGSQEQLELFLSHTDVKDYIVQPKIEGLVVTVDVCRQAADALGVTGCVNFEFIEGSDGVYHMLECNPRFAGGVEFSCMAGYDCVINHLRCFTGEDIEPSDNITGMYIARKYEEYITKITDRSRT